MQTNSSVKKQIETELKSFSIEIETETVFGLHSAAEEIVRHLWTLISKLEIKYIVFFVINLYLLDVLDFLIFSEDHFNFMFL